MNLIHRVEATQQTIDQHFMKPFEWRAEDCAHLVWSHLDSLGIENRRAEGQPYSNYRGAVKALKAMGWTDMRGLLADHNFEEIAPASAIVGDILAIHSDKKSGPMKYALGVAIGDGRVLAYADNGEAGPRCLFGPIDFATHAWRVR